MVANFIAKTAWHVLVPNVKVLELLVYVNVGAKDNSVRVYGFAVELGAIVIVVPGADPQVVALAPAAVFHAAVAPIIAQLLEDNGKKFDVANVKVDGTQQVVADGLVVAV